MKRIARFAAKYMIAASAKGYDEKKRSDAAEGGAMARRTMGGRTDGTIARISDVAAKAQRRTKRRDNKRRRDDDKGSAAANEAAQRYKFYRPHKLHSHLVAQIKF